MAGATGRDFTRREVLGRATRAGAGAYLFGALPALERAFPALGEERPNILFVFSDDHAVQAISAYGSRINHTPHIDRIATEGAIFLNSFCTNSICAPSRAVVLTGKHSHVNGKIDNSAQDPFDTGQPTFNKALQAAGSLQWLERERDPDRPFLLMCQHKAPHRNWMPGPDHLMTYEDVEIPEPESLFDDYLNRASPAALQEMSIREHLQPAYDLKITPEAPEDPDDPFPGYARMTPAQRAAWDAAYGPRNTRFREANPQGDDRVRWYYQRYIKDYLRCIAGIDDNVGRMLAYLDDTGLARDTLVIYCSDQGFYLGEHGWYDKRWMYEESLSMPLLARWPGRIAPGTRIPHLVQNIDYAPTFLEMAGEPVPGDIQGESLLGLLTGRTTDGWRDSIYYHYYEYPQPHRVAPHYGIRTERYKLVHYYGTGEWELFDLEEDPGELNSVYADPARSGLVDELKAELRRLREFYGDETGVGF
jgi:arylsulfatase A-like enzyme